MKERLRDMKDYMWSPNKYVIGGPEKENTDNWVKGST